MPKNIKRIVKLALEVSVENRLTGNDFNLPLSHVSTTLHVKSCNTPTDR